MRINELRGHLVQYDMIEVFSILQFPPSFNGELLHPLPDKIDLLSKWDSVSEDTLHAHIRFLRRHGQDWDFQNLDWSHEFIHVRPLSSALVAIKFIQVLVQLFIGVVFVPKMVILTPNR